MACQCSTHWRAGLFFIEEEAFPVPCTCPTQQQAPLSLWRSACCVGQVQGTGKASSSIKKRPNGQVNTSFLRPSILPAERTYPPPCPHLPNFITKRSRLDCPPRLLYATCVLEQGFAPCTLLHHRPTLRGALGHVSSTAFGVEGSGLGCTCGPRHGPTVGSLGGAVFYRRGTPVALASPLSAHSTSANAPGGKCALV
jgi:hypothetical protein